MESRVCILLRPYLSLLILLRKSGQHTPYDLRAMVRQVNREQVAPEEQLSNEVFEYRGKERQLLPCRIKERERER